MSSATRLRIPREPAVVAIGASTGGLVAFQTILASLPDELSAAVLLVQHRSPEPDSRLVELLQKHSTLRVLEPDDKEPIVIGQVYLAPAGYHMLADNAAIALSTDPPVGFARPSIDVLFESVADAYGAQAIAVVLTGASADGAAGAAAVQAAGGRVLVEDPASAISPELPRAVIEMIRPDAVLPLPEIAPTIVRWCTPSSARPVISTRS